MVQIMEKALKRKKRYTFLSVIVFIFAIVFFALAVVMLNETRYPQLIICSVVSAFCFYFTVFFAFSAYDASVAVKVIAVISELGDSNIGDIAERIGWKRTAVRKFIKKIKKHGYIL